MRRRRPTNTVEATIAGATWAFALICVGIAIAVIAERRTPHTTFARESAADGKAQSSVVPSRRE